MIAKNDIIAATRQEMLELLPIHYKSGVKIIDNYDNDKVYIWCENITELLDHHDIPENKRAFLYNTYNDEAANWSSGYHIVAHIDFAIKYSTFQKKWQIDLHYSALSIEDENFLRKTRRNIRENALPPQILQVIKNDSESELEIACLLNNKKNSLNMMYAILTYQAENIIHYFFEKYVNEIFSL